MDDSIETDEDLAQLARLAVNQQTEDVRLFVDAWFANTEASESPNRWINICAANPQEVVLIMRKTIRKEDPSYPVACR